MFWPWQPSTHAPRHSKGNMQLHLELRLPVCRRQRLLHYPSRQELRLLHPHPETQKILKSSEHMSSYKSKSLFLTISSPSVKAIWAWLPLVQHQNLAFHGTSSISVPQMPCDNGHLPRFSLLPMLPGLCCVSTLLLYCSFLHLTSKKGAAMPQ